MNIPNSFIAQYTNQSISSIHHTLRASRRRLIVLLLIKRTTVPSGITTDPSKENPLRFVAENDLTVSVRQLTREIVAIEEDITVEQATGEEYRNVYTALNQTHLPQLDKTSVVEYDPDRKTVRPDKNLFAVATIAAVTSPIAQILFHNTVVELSKQGSISYHDSMGD